MRQVDHQPTNSAPWGEEGSKGWRLGHLCTMYVLRYPLPDCSTYIHTYLQYNGLPLLLLLLDGAWSWMLDDERRRGRGTSQAECQHVFFVFCRWSSIQHPASSIQRPAASSQRAGEQHWNTLERCKTLRPLRPPQRRRTDTMVGCAVLRCTLRRPACEWWALGVL